MAAVFHILLVEDEPDQRALYMQVLGMAGYQVVAVPDAETALQHLAHHRFDVILSDWNLPGMPGDALLASAKADYPAMKTVLMSNHCQLRKAAQETGVDGCYEKGDIHRLVTTLTRVLTVDTQVNTSS